MKTAWLENPKDEELKNKGGKKEYVVPLFEIINLKDSINNLLNGLLNSLEKMDDTNEEIDKTNEEIDKTNEEIDKTNERKNNDIFREISDILFSLHDNGFKHILNKDIFLNIYMKCVDYKPRSVSFSTLILNYLDVFSGLDQDVVNIILEKENEDRTNKKRAKRANMILLNIKSFGKVDIIRVLSIFSENFGFIEDKFVNRMFYSGYIKGELEFKEKMIKDLIDAGYLDDLKKCYNFDYLKKNYNLNKNPLENFGITENELERIAKK